MPSRRHSAEGCKQTINVQAQPNHEQLDERPLCGIGAGRNKNEEKKKKAENSVEFFFFFKTVCNTNLAKTIVQKVTKQQSLRLMQYRLYRSSHDGTCGSATVDTKGTKETLNISTHSLCLGIFFSPKISIQQTDILDQPSKLWWRCAVQKRPRRYRSPEGHEDPQRLGREQYLVCGHGLWWKMWAS